MQLDGWRALAVVGVMWHHWAPRDWRGPLPFEIGLYFFLTLTGFLITRILLRERAAGEASGVGWRWRAWVGFLQRRFGRILVPCYVAMAFAAACGAGDLLAHPFFYLFHLSNFHMAYMEGWPSGTAHYWTLAIQMQFYLLWPLVVWWVPRRLLGGCFGLCLLLAPMSRWILEGWFPEVRHPGAMSTSALDYFGAGALLALVLERMPAGRPRWLGAVGWVAFAAYAVLYILAEAGHPVVPLAPFQQTFLSLAMAALIGGTLRGLGGPLGMLLEHPVVQHLGRLSYGLYLFHTAVPLMLGWLIPWIWQVPLFPGSLPGLRIVCFSIVSYAIARLCWRWFEGPARLRLAGRGAPGPAQ